MYYDITQFLKANVGLTLRQYTIFAISAKAQVPPVEPTDTDFNGIRNVSTLNHLQWITTNYTYCCSDSFELDNNINAGDTRNWYYRFMPIGTGSLYPFWGKFYGKNHSIDSLFIGYPNGGYWADTLGFICRSLGLIKDLSLTNCNIIGNNTVGAVVGANHATIENCSSSGYVEGYVSEINYTYNIGGLVGYNTGVITSCHSSADVVGCEKIGGLIGMNYSKHYDIEVTNCYSTGGVKGKKTIGGLIGWTQGYNWLVRAPVSKCYSVSNVYGERWVGGFVGQAINYSMIDNSYAMGRVIGLAQLNDYGGFIGNNDYISYVTNCYSQGAVVASGLFIGGFIGQCGNQLNVTDCYWDRDISGLTSGYPVGSDKTSSQMQDQLTFPNWDFVNIWDINPNENGKYPHLRDVTPVINVLKPEDPDSDGFKNIATLKNLRWVSEYSELGWSDNYELDGSLVAYPTNEWNFDTGFNPIGNLTTPYTGQFNGNNYYIDRLFINRPTEDYIGLFGYVSKGAQIRNLRLRYCDFTGNEYVGGLAGRVANNNSTPLLLLPIENCITTGEIVGQKYVGGLIGEINCGTGDASGTYLSRSASKCNVTGLATSDGYAGGLVGFTNGAIINCYARGTVTGFDYTAGGVGYNDGLVEKSYSTGLVNSNNNISGFTAGGYGTDSDCYWDMTTSNRTLSYGAASGQLSPQMINPNTFVGWDFTNIWECIASQNNNYPSFRGVPIYKINTNNNEFSITSESIKLDISPNPVCSEANVTINSDKDIYANILIYNTLGQLVKSCYSGNISKGTKILNLNLQDLNEGSYYLIIENKGILSCKTIVISR